MKKLLQLFLFFFCLTSVISSFARVNNVTIITKDLTCNDISDGEAYVDGASIISTGTGPYEFIWFGGSIVGSVTTDTIKNLDNGFYNLRVRDLSDGTLSGIFLFQIADVPPFSAQPDSVSVSCFGVCDGKVWVTGIGGTPRAGVDRYFYQWDDPAMSTTDTASNLCPGRYNVTITDDNGCTAVASAGVLSPAQISPNLNVTDIDCNGNNNGSADASGATGGTGTYTTYRWSSDLSNNTPMEGGLSQGTYTLTITDSDGCTATETFTIDEPVGLSATIATVDVDCFGDSTGEATATTMGGTAPITFNWPASGTAAANMVTDLGANNYNVTITDANNCQIIEPFVINQNNEILIALDSMDVDCNGNTTGSVSATISGGIAPYNWNWSSGVNGSGAMAQSPNLAAQTYTITVTDALNCTKVDSIVVNEPPVLGVTVDGSTNPSCAGGSDGTIDITIFGGTTPYNVAWSDGNMTDQDRTGLTAGTYNLLVTDANNCTVNTGVTLMDPSAIQANILVESTSCRGGNDGVATAVPTGGSGIYVSYAWSSMNGTDSIETGLAAGNYTVTITDSDGCTRANNFTITEPATAFMVTIAPTDADCFGASTGSATATPTGGDAPYTFAWNDLNNTTGATVNNLAAGMYMVTATDGNGCEQIVGTTIGEPTDILLDLDSTDVGCNGESTGSVTAMVSGGTSPYNWSWSDGTNGAIPPAINATANGLNAGTYTITVTDANGCSKVDSIVVNEPTPLLVAIDGQTDPLCVGDMNGTILITASGGTVPAYTYQWSDLDPSEDRTGLANGTYTVTVTDGNGCTATATTTLTDPAALTAVIDSLEDASCNGLMDGFARVLANGGTGTYTYEWPGMINTRSNPNLSAGTYIVTVSDANSCTTTATATIGEPTALTASASSTDASCSGFPDGTATASEMGGTAPFTYAWSTMPTQTTQTATGLVSNTYTVTVTDANGCTDSQSVFVDQPATISLTTTQINVDCNGASTGSATVNPTGGTAPLTFQWDDPAMQTNATATGLSANTYNVVVTDANGCNDNISVTITEPNAVVATILMQTDPTCNGIDDGSITASGTGGTGAYTFAWSTIPVQNTATASMLGAGTYTVTVTDNNGCTGTTQATLTAPPSVIVNLQNQQNIDCFGGNEGFIKVSTTGGTPNYTFNWDPATVSGQGTDSIFNLTAGTYTATVSDNNGCFIVEQYIITEPSSPLSASFDTTDASCNGAADGNAKVTVTGGTIPYTYAWEGNPNGNPNDSIFNLVANTYRVTVTDNNGCTLVDSTLINEPPQINITLNSKTDVLCNGDLTGDADVTATGGAGAPYDYRWNDPSMTNNPVVTGLSNGTYTVTVSDANMCTEELTVVINSPDTLKPSLFINNVSCGAPANGTAAIRATGGVIPYTYNWSPTIVDGAGTDSVFNLAPGNYSVTVTDNNGCDSIQAFTIGTVNSNYTYVDSVRNDSCNGTCNGYIEIRNLSGGTAPYTFNWSRANETTAFINNVCAGNYTVTISDATGCDSIASFTITEPAPLTATFDTTDISCNGLTDGNAKITVLGGTMPFTYSWEGNPMGNPNDSIFALSRGTYRVTVTDANGCSLVDSTEINEPAAITINQVSKTDVLCNGDFTGSATVLATGGTSTFNYLWNDPSSTTGPAVGGLAVGTYTVTATDGNLCTETFTVVINEPDTLKPTLFTYDISCGSTMDGAAAVRVTGGVGPYVFQWDPATVSGQGTDSIFNLTAGTYTVTVTDNNLCDSVQTFTIGGTNSSFTYMDSVRNDSCGGACNGYLEIQNISGGVAPYSYLWSRAGETTPFIDNLCVGTYTVTISDATGCDSITQYTISEPSAITATIRTIPDTCIASLGEATATNVMGGTMPYTYTWPASGTAAGATVTDLAAGNYNLTITDMNLCETILPFTIGNEAPFSISLITTDANCNGTTDGTIRVSTVGATNPVTYNWEDNTLSGAIPNPVGVGTYPITVTDANGCAAIDTARIGEPSTLSTSLVVVGESCIPGNDGSATATTLGGTMPYTYDWGAGTTSMNSINTLVAGDYTVTITDANACQITETFNIGSTAPYTVAIATTDASCNGGNNGTILVTVTGATGVLTYDWPAGSGLVGDNPTNAAQGTYIVTVTDATNCSETATAVIGEETPIVTTFSSRQDESCSPGVDGFARVVATGGVMPYTYDWTPSITVANGNGTDSVFNLVAGFYNVTVTDANMCTQVAPITINAASNIASNPTYRQPSCFGDMNGSITLAPSGGVAPYSIDWGTTTGPMLGSLTSGNYTATITDNAVPPCVKVETFTLDEPAPISVNVNTALESCNPANDGAATVTVSGGVMPFTYVFSGGTVGASPNIVEGLNAGNYSVTITDANSCTRIEPFSINSATNFGATLAAVDASCNGAMDGEFLVTVGGGTNPLSYNWSTSSLSGADPTNIGAGTYTITITDVYGCTATQTGTIDEPLAITATFAITDESCVPGNDGAVVATPMNGQGSNYTFQWPVAGSGNSVSGLNAGNYNVTITDDSSCFSVIPFTIGSTAPFTLTSNIRNIDCAGNSNGAIDLTVTGVTPMGAETYQWSSNVGAGNQNLEDQNNLVAGTYSVTITDPSNGCAETETFVVTEPDTLRGTAAITNVGCILTADDGAIDLTVVGGTAPFTFDWSNGPTMEDISNLMVGTYTVTITDGNSCVAVDSFTVTNQLQLTLSLDSTDVSCAGAMDGEVRSTTNAGAPVGYAWSGPNGPIASTASSITALSGGKYFVTVTDGVNACTAVDSIIVNERDTIKSSFTLSDADCFPGNNGTASASTNGGLPPYTYLWSGGTSTGNNVVTNLAASNYTVVVTDGAGCSVVESFTIGSAAPFTVNFTTTEPVCAGDATGTINVSVVGNIGNPLTYDWPSPLPSQDNQSGLTAGTYTVTITDPANGCTETTPIIINEPDSIKATAVITPETCNPGSNGAINITATGGDSGPYTYNWAGVPNPNQEDQTGLSAGTYTVTITDGNSCIGIDSFIVRAISTTIPNLTTVNDGCSPFAVCLGSAKAAPTGGVSPYTFAWAGPGGPIASTMDSISSLCGGNYSLTITDASGCDTVVTFMLESGRTVDPNPIITNESCNVDDDGSISVTPSGGEAPYAYAWANSTITDSLRTGLAPGTYTVTITDVSQCDTVIALTVGTEQFDYTINKTDLTCNGTCDGTADVVITGGSAGFTFAWDPVPTTGAGTANISDLCDGKYKVTITNTANGCVKIDSVTLNPATPVAPVVNATDETCNGLSDGTITLTTTGGVGNYTYTWLPNVSTGSSASGLSGGTYAITVADAAGCDTSFSVNIQSAPLILGNVVTQDLSCGNLTSCNGRAVATPTNGASPYNYNWGAGVVTGMTPDTAINLCAGSYAVTITDNDGCSIVENFTIGGPSPIAANFTVTNSTCGLSNGEISTAATGGSGTYSYQWFDAMSNSLGMGTSINSLAAGFYSVIITDNTGCSETFNTSVNDIGAEIVTTSFTDVSCFGGNDGSATASFTCSDPNCTVEWFDAATGTSLNIFTNTASGLSQGNYYVEVTNNSSCKAVENITISQPPQLQLFTIITDNSCGGGNTGAISLNASGGSGMFSYTWSPTPANGQGTSNISGLTTGTWVVTITDANACDSIASFVINEPLAITSTFSTSSSNCNMSDGSITATVAGGTVIADYEYQWFDGNNVLLIGETTPVLANVSSGSYALRVRDDNVCEKLFPVTLSDINGPTVVVDSTDDVSCFGGNNGAIFITASGANAPFTYNWLPTGETTEDVFNLSEGTYTVRVTDALGCITNAIDTIKSPTELMATVTPQEATCGICNGEASITVSGGTAPYTYLWSNGSTTTTTNSLCGGNYSVVVTDANGCSKSFDFGVNTVGGPTGETLTLSPTSCANSQDGSATVVPVGGTPPYTYMWQHNNASTNSLSNLGKGTYFLQVSDVKGCSRTVQVDIDGPDAINIAEQITGVTCNSTPCDGSILLNVSGGSAPYTYNWGTLTTADTNFVDALCAGVYNVSVTDANGCIEARVLTVSNTGVPVIPQPTITDVSCYNTCTGSLISNIISPAVNYQWLDDQGSPIAAVNTDLNSSVCAGTYVLEVTTIAFGCKSYTSFDINEPDSITLSSSIVKNVTCNGDCDGEIFVNTRGGNILYNYSWDDPSMQDVIPAVGLCAGTYGVTATDANGCTATTSVTLVDPPMLTVNITSNTNLICSSDCDATASSVGTGGTAPYTFNWSSGQTIADPTTLCFGENILTLTDALGCTAVDTVFISATDTVIAETTGSPIVCDGDSIRLRGTITGNSINSFGWYLADGTTLFTTSLDTTFIAPIGNYTYQLIALSNTCSDTAKFDVAVTANPIIGLDPILRLFNDEVATISITNEDPSYTYSWNPSTNLTDSTIAEPLTNTKEDITYTLTVTDTNGCVFVDSIQVFYSPDLDIPTGITPNGDGNNDVWNIQYLSEFPNASVQIFNRWGTLLFESNNGYTTPWDGTYKGEALPIGTYYYVIDVKDPKVKPITGPVTIVK